MKRMILIVSTLFISATPIQAMSNQLLKGIAATAGTAALVSSLAEYYNINQHAALQSQIDAISAQRTEIERLRQAREENLAAQRNATGAELAELKSQYEQLREENNRRATAYNTASAELTRLHQQRNNALSAAASWKQRSYTTATIGLVSGVTSGLITPRAAAITAVVAGATEQLYTHCANNTPTNEATLLYEAAWNCKLAMLASGATALATAAAQYGPNMVSSAFDMLGTAATATKVGIGLTTLAGTVAIGIKVAPPVVNAINRIKSVAAWFGA